MALVVLANGVRGRMAPVVATIVKRHHVQVYVGVLVLVGVKPGRRERDRVATAKLSCRGALQERPAPKAPS